VTFEVNEPAAPTVTDPLEQDGVELLKASVADAAGHTVTVAEPVRVPSPTVNALVSAATRMTDATPTPLENVTVAG
jgi:hypothetical protein